MFQTKTIITVLALALCGTLGACGSDAPPSGTGNTNGGGNTGGSPPVDEVAQAINALCNKFDECNQLADVGDIFIGAPISLSECVEIETACVDTQLLIQSLKDDWALAVQDCLEISTCALFFDCWAFEVPSC